MSASFLSCDWGTTNFRLRRGNASSAGTSAGPSEVRNDSGAAKLAAAGGDRAAAFRHTLEMAVAALSAPADWPVLISGMASSTIGWQELPYATLPFSLDGSDVVTARLDDRIHLISGIRGERDMARGEETQALGLAAWLGSRLPGRACFILPGTHSKHLEIVEGRIVGLRTHMTGELFDVLLRHSVLRHTTDPSAPFDPDSFSEGVDQVARDPLTGLLFQTRTRQVLSGRPSAANTSFLSGLLIGAELATLRGGDAVNRDVPIFLAAGSALRTAYAQAARVMGIADRMECVDSDALTARGHEVLWRRWSANAS
jgi:2-dehydro-3-deoxygalactonokinase